MKSTLSAQEADFLRRAVRLAAARSQRKAGGPFGALIVRDGVVIGRGWNEVTSRNDPTAHAEVAAIRRACRKLGDFRLRGCVLYSSCEPCPMCLAAAYWARVDRIVYAAGRKDAAAIGFDDVRLYQELTQDPASRSLPMVQALRKEAAAMMRAWAARPDRVLY